MKQVLKKKVDYLSPLILSIDDQNELLIYFHLIFSVLLKFDAIYNCL